MITKRILSWGFAALLMLAACKKDKPSTETGTETPPPTTTPPVTGTASALDLMRDSVYLYAKQVYYWYDALPEYSTFNPRSFTGTDELDALKKEVYALSRYKTNTETGLPYENRVGSTTAAKYSYVDNGESSERLNAVTGDFGFAPGFQTNTDLRVLYVYPGSPADNAGLKRGYQITSINGQTDLSYTTANISFIVNAYANSSSITMTLRRPDNTTFSVSINTTAYVHNPVLSYKVVTSGSKKVGYLAFNSYVTKATAQAPLDAAFAAFATQNVSELVVDLRYNGGGYTNTAEYLVNLIAPASANGKTMYTSYYNSFLATNPVSLLKNQWRRDANGTAYNYDQLDFSVAGNTKTFSKQGTVNVSRVFFLVTGSTASSSELTINNLRPYMDVQLIGSTTFGKPVGFFDIKINKYEMYLAEFETKNSLGQGGYYLGMVPGSAQYAGKLSNDDYTKDFGDVNDVMFSQALAFIANGKYNSQDTRVESTRSNTISIAEQNSFNQQINPYKLNGMLEEHPLRKK